MDGNKKKCDKRPHQMTQVTYSCAGCLQKSNRLQHMTCKQCNNRYDLECANITIKQFEKTMTKQEIDSWICQLCRSRLPKLDNSNTPIRPQLTSPLNSSDLINITVRNTTSIARNAQSSQTDDDFSIMGDTFEDKQGNYDPDTNTNSPQTSILKTVIKQMEKLLDEKLEKNRLCMIPEIKLIINTEVKNAVNELKHKLMENIDTLTTDQHEIKKDISKIYNKIEEIECEKNKLQNTIDYLQSQINHLKQHTFSSRQNIPQSKEKIIILYGLQEYQYECEEELHDRIVAIFQDYLSINVIGYIEDISRLGKRGYRRPLRIELLSKKITSIILRNKRNLKHSGLAITEFLDRDTLMEQKKLRNIMIDARKKGQHAVIRNNTLFIDGKEFKLDSPAQNQPPGTQNSELGTTQTNEKNVNTSQLTFRDSTLAEDSQQHPKPKPRGQKSPQSFRNNTFRK